MNKIILVAWVSIIMLCWPVKSLWKHDYVLTKEIHDQREVLKYQQSKIEDLQRLISLQQANTSKLITNLDSVLDTQIRQASTIKQVYLITSFQQETINLIIQILKKNDSKNQLWEPNPELTNRN